MYGIQKVMVKLRDLPGMLKMKRFFHGTDAIYGMPQVRMVLPGKKKVWLLKEVKKEHTMTDRFHS